MEETALYRLLLVKRPLLLIKKQRSFIYLKSLNTSFFADYLEASSTATAQATVAPTIGLLPIPIRPIIST